MSSIELRMDHVSSSPQHPLLSPCPRPEYPPEPTPGYGGEQHPDQDPYGQGPDQVTMITEDSYPYATTSQPYYAKEDHTISTRVRTHTHVDTDIHAHTHTHTHTQTQTHEYCAYTHTLHSNYT